MQAPWAAWQACDTGRRWVTTGFVVVQKGVGGLPLVKATPLRISWEEINRWCDRYPSMGIEWREDIIELVTTMDSEYLSWRAEKDEMERKQAQG